MSLEAGPASEPLRSAAMEDYAVVLNRSFEVTVTSA
jgi:hypothetical protein